MWYKQIHPYNQHEMRLNIAAGALIVIDMQRFFLNPTSPSFTCGGVAILPTVKRLIDIFRRMDRPVILHQARPSPEQPRFWDHEMVVEGHVYRRQSRK